MKVWVTRSAPGADATAARLRDLGHEPIVAPVLVVSPLDLRLDLSGIDALAFTSANAVRAYAALTPRRDFPVWTVGVSTAQAALKAGFDRVTASEGDVVDLGVRLAADLPRGGVVMHPCALELAGDLASPLAAAGISLRPAPIYQTVIAAVGGAIRTALDTADVVLLHSPKGARALNQLLAAHSTRIERALCLSAAVAAVLDGGKIATVSSAALPNDTALLKLLQKGTNP
jgi:uroporphyrinogen-III synthase